MNIKDMEWQLNLIAGSAAFTKEVRLAAQYANELLRSFRTIEDLSWNTNAKDLHSMAILIGDDLNALKEAELRSKS